MTKIMRVIKKSPVKSAGGLHGVDVGTLWAGAIIAIEYGTPDSPHDNWVHIIGPNPPIDELTGFYLKTGKEGWVEYAHLSEINQEHTVVSIDIDWTSKTWTARES